MKHAMAWIKSNPITVVSIIVVLLSLGFLGWVHLRGAALEARMSQRQQVASNISGLRSSPIEVPPTDPDAPQDQRTVTVNQWVIDTMDDIYGRIGSEYQKIRDQAVQINQEGHLPLVENLFPETERADLPFVAQEQYLRSFEVMLSDPAEEIEEGLPSLAALPRLDAGLPPPNEEIQAAVARVEYEFRSAPGLSGQQLTPEEQQTLFNEQRQKAIELMTYRAESLGIYADPDMQSPDYPFDILPWALQNERPKPYQLWEGQIELWFQQDIARAIVLANDLGNGASGVLTSPVKRLVKIDVLPGYVGLHTLGAMSTSPVAVSADGLYSAPAGGMTGTPDRRLPDNFYASPTGRVSNALYDVRHARLTVLIDFARLPRLFNALSQVNFMTVLKVEMEDVDEYEALQQGYVYGPNDDVVQVTLTLESVWLRDWTQAYMPNLVQQYLGLRDPTELNAVAAPVTGGYEAYPGMDPYGGYDLENPYGAP